MNDIERKLRQQPFRTPPAELRDAIFGAPANAVTPAVWTWRDWLWPSPGAWGALAAVWVLFAAVSFRDRPDSPAPAFTFTQQAPSGVTLLSHHQARDFSYVLDLAN